MIKRLSSLRLFYVCAILLLLACVLGGVIPQNESLEHYQHLFGDAKGRWVAALGLHDVFHSVWFMTLLAFSALNLAACSFRRWQALRHRPGVFLSHIAILLMFAGGIVRGATSLRGNLALEVGQSANEVLREEAPPFRLPFTVKLDDFKVQYWESEKHVVHAVRGSDGLRESAEARLGEMIHFNPIGIWVEPVRFFPDFVVTAAGPASRGEARENPALEVMVRDGGEPVKRYLFARFPDMQPAPGPSGARLYFECLPGRIRQFESELVILENGAEAARVRIHVNKPFSHRGYRFYQAGYDPARPNFSRIEVSKDPSVPLMYTGFILLLIGLGWAFLGSAGLTRR